MFWVTGMVLGVIFLGILIVFLQVSLKNIKHDLVTAKPEFLDIALD